MGRALVMMMAAVMLIANTCSSIQKKREIEQLECQQDSIQVETPKKTAEFWDDDVVSSVAAANAAVL